MKINSYLTVSIPSEIRRIETQMTSGGFFSKWSQPNLDARPVYLELIKGPKRFESREGGFGI